MSGIPEIGVHELKAMLDAGEPVCLLDVRQPWEFEIGHLAGSLLMPLPELAHRSDEIEAPDGALVVTICHHGVRSLDAAWLLARNGMRVASLAGGIDRWSVEIDPAIPRY